MGNMFGGLKGQTRRLRSDYYSSNHGEASPSSTDRQVEHEQLIGISRFLYIHIGELLLVAQNLFPRNEWES